MRKVFSIFFLSRVVLLIGMISVPMAVTGQYGTVHGMEGLRIVDASIMPDLVRAPINPTVLMIGERIADAIS